MDMKMTVTQEEDCYTHKSLETGGMACHAGGPWWEAGGRASKGKIWARACSVISSGKEWAARQGKQAEDWLL